MRPIDHIRNHSGFKNLEISEQVKLLADHVRESDNLHNKIDKIDIELARIRITNFIYNIFIILLLISIAIIFVIVH